MVDTRWDWPIPTPCLVTCFVVSVSRSQIRSFLQSPQPRNMLENNSKTADAYGSSSSASFTSVTSSASLPSLAMTLPSMDKAQPSVPTLTLMLNRPERMPRNVDVWNRLQRIAAIDVQPADSSSTHDQQYAVSVLMYHSQNRIPTNYNRATETTPLLGSPASSLSALSTTGSATSTEKADVSVVRSFPELEALRSRVCESIRQYHPVYCQLCDGLNVLMLTKLAMPTLFNVTIHRSAVARAKKMRKLLLRVLSELHQHKAQCVPACQGQHDLPLLLHSFIFGEGHSETTAQTLTNL